MNGLPVGDVQFWIVTAVAAAVVLYGAWRVVRFFRGGKKRGKSVSLTVEREERE